MEWFISVFRDSYADFSGRARRREYWQFTLVQAILLIILAAIAFGLMAVSEETGNEFLSIVGFAPLVLYGLGAAIPNLAVSVRRLHDVGKSGWWILSPHIPLVGNIFSIVLLIFYCQDGQWGDNQWGPNPKEEEKLSEIFE